MEYAYGIIISDFKSGYLINDDDINKANSILKSHFNSNKYAGHMDHLMLFNFYLTIYNNCGSDENMLYNKIFLLFVRTLSPISHKLFIPAKSLRSRLNTPNDITLDNVYNSYPSYRFDKFFNGTYFALDENLNIKFGIKSENSHILNIY